MTENVSKEQKMDTARYHVGRVAVQTEPVIVSRDDKEQLDLYGAVAKILVLLNELNGKLS